MQRFSLSRLIVTVLMLFAFAAVTNAADFSASDYQRRTIYHSPQTPGFTCWTNALTMPDGSLMVSFTQATGPLTGRPHAPKDVQEKLDWPPPGMPGYDMTGLDLRNVHLRSTDDGKSWQQVSADAFRTCMNSTAEAENALADGTILRGEWGYYLPYNPELPKTGFLERSTDGSKTWGKPEVFLDPAKYSAWPKRIHQLRDGRIIITGGIVYAPANSLRRYEYDDLLEPFLVVSNDSGKTWTGPIQVVPDKYHGVWGGEECDAAELGNGDLLFVFRRYIKETKTQVRWEGVMKKSGDSWNIADVHPAPFPHSGHPELLVTHEGPILHIATSGIDYTVDGGNTWRKLNVPGTAYYPRAVQARDGRIFIFSHRGSDDPYGKIDQSIVMDSFRLK